MNKLYSTILALMIGAVFCSAQTTQLNESFTSPFNFSSAGWYKQNNSSPIGQLTWAQGVGTLIPAYSGGADDYLRNNYNSQGASSGNISDWLVTPTVSLMNGGVVQFYSRTLNNPTSYADRLVLLMSIGNGTGAIPATVSGVGTFTQTILTINPNLTSTGYPAAWTLFTATLSGITGTVNGRFAFHYDVPNGGINGANSEYIGIDDVMYTTTAPCPSPTITITPSNTTICQGQPAEIVLNGAASYTVDGDPVSTPTIQFAPVSTWEYTVTGTSQQGCFGTNTFTINVVPFPTVEVTSATVCPGASATLQASGANTYSWSNGATTSSIVVTVNTNTYYTVLGFALPGCYGYASASVNTNTFLSVPAENVTACPDAPYILGAVGADTYTWSTGAVTSSIVITPTGSATYYVTGTSGGCNETKKVNVDISPNIFAPSFTTCAGTSATLVAMGATSYSWSTGATGSLVVVSPTADAVYNVKGMSGNCSQTKTLSVTIGTKLSIATAQSCVGQNGQTLLLQAFGATNFTWYPTNEHTQFIFVSPTGPSIYTLAGTSGSCAGTTTIAFNVCPGISELNSSFGNVSIFPNPFNGDLTISGATGEVILINSMGQIVLQTRVGDALTIATHELAPGVYFVVITDKESGSRMVRKVLKE
jgi:hypothetical protein